MTFHEFETVDGLRVWLADGSIVAIRAASDGAGLLTSAGQWFWVKEAPDAILERLVIE